MMSVARENHTPTLIHEYGHRRERDQRGSLGMLVQRVAERDQRFARPNAPPRTKALWSQEPESVRNQMQAYNRLDAYSKTNANEAYAQSFEQAVKLLRDYGHLLGPKGNSQNASPEEIRQVFAQELGNIEGQFPGTGSLLTELLAEKPYRSHPLNAMLSATASRRTP
jgi:hypothetical protein